MNDHEDAKRSYFTAGRILAKVFRELFFLLELVRLLVSDFTLIPDNVGFFQLKDGSCMRDTI